jgi:non-canonical (house-cleaning) NTP pyrophosphatase
LFVTPFSHFQGVSDQPFGDAETREGARNRAQNALSAAQKQNATTEETIRTPFDFAVGLEGGLEKVINPYTKQNELYCMAWMTIAGRRNFTCSSEDDYDDENLTNSDMSWSYAKTASFLLPPQICELVMEQNMELGHADDQVFDRVNSKHGSGTVGILTKGEIDRKNYYVHALKLCLIPWVTPELYLRNVNR